MQGLFLFGSRPKSKKAVREYIDGMYPSQHEPSNIIATDEQNDGYGLVIEATSPKGNEYDGSIHSAPTNITVNFVGPDPYTNRKFYGTISWNKGRWVCK